MAKIVLYLLAPRAGRGVTWHLARPIEGDDYSNRHTLCGRNLERGWEVKAEPASIEDALGALAPGVSLCKICCSVVGSEPHLVEIAPDRIKFSQRQRREITERLREKAGFVSDNAIRAGIPRWERGKPSRSYEEAIVHRACQAAFVKLKQRAYGKEENR